VPSMDKNMASMPDKRFTAILPSWTTDLWRQ